jgi:hypothetical protein
MKRSMALALVAGFLAISIGALSEVPAQAQSCGNNWQTQRAQKMRKMIRKQKRQAARMQAQYLPSYNYNNGNYNALQYPANNYQYPVTGYSYGVDPYASGLNPYASGINPYASGINPYASGINPYLSGLSGLYPTTGTGTGILQNLLTLF